MNNKEFDSFNNNLDSEDEQDINHDADNENQNYINNIKKILQKLFHFYASFGNKTSNNYIKESQIIKMLYDCDYINNNISQKDIELKFHKISKGKKLLNFETFWIFSSEIAQYNFKNKDENANYIKFLENYMYPLYNKIIKITDVGLEENIFQEEISNSIILIIEYKKDYFKNLYLKYFDIESKLKIKYNKNKKLNEWKLKLVNFLKDYQIIPNFIKIPMVNQIFNDIIEIDENDNNYKNSYIKLIKIINDNNKEILFSFSKFLFFIIKLSNYIFAHKKNLPQIINLKDLNNNEKFYLFLEIIEVNSKFLLNSSKIKKNYYKKWTLSAQELINIHEEDEYFPNFIDLLVKYQYDENFMIIKLKIKKNQYKNNYSISSKQNKSINKTDKKVTKKRNISNLITNKKKIKVSILDINIKPVLEKYKEILNEIFIKYSEIDKNNKNNRFISKPLFHKLIMELKIELIPNSSIDGIFNNIIKFSSNNSKCMDLLLFLKSIEHISKFLYQEINIEYAFEQFIIDYIIKNLNNEINDSDSDNDNDNSLNNSRDIDISCNSYENNIKSNYKKPNNIENESKTKIELNKNLLKEFIDTMKNQKIIKILGEFFKIVNSYILSTRILENGIDFDIYLSLIKKVNIYPKIVNINKVKEIFIILGFIYNKKNNINSSQYDLIDENLFTESFILIAISLKLKSIPDTFNKLCFLIYLICSSEPVNKTNFIENWENKFPGFFEFKEKLNIN